jgi:hypothetical protein
MVMAVSDRKSIKKTESPEKPEKPKGNGTKYTDEVHPYMTPEFWVDEKNHFWKRSSMFKQESYGKFIPELEKKVKTNLIMKTSID